MPMTEWGWVPDEYDMYGPQITDPAQIAAWQQQYWLPQIAAGGYIPPQYDNAEAMAALGQTDAYNQRMQYLDEQGQQRLASLQDHMSDSSNGGIAAQAYALAGMGLGTAGALAGGAGAGGLTGVTTAGTPMINNAIPFTSGVPAASAFGTGGITSGALAGASNVLDSSGSVIPGTEAGGGAMSGLSGLLGGLGDWAPLIGGLLGAVDAHNQPDSMSTNTGGTSSSTYGTQLPGQITGTADQLLTHMNNLYGGGGAQVAGADPLIQQAMSRLQNMGTNPFSQGAGWNTSPTASSFVGGANQNTAPTTSGFASGQYNNTAPTASSFAGGQGINPYLDQVFNAAADSTQNRLATEFANAGVGALNSGSHGAARSQELQNLAAGIYAPGYEAERNRQYGAQESSIDRLLAQMEGNLGRQYGATESGLTRGLAQTDSNLSRQLSAEESSLSRLLQQMTGNLDRQFSATEGDLSRQLSSVSPMLQAGDYLRQIQQQQMNQPYDNFQQYIAGLQGLLPFYPGTQTQSTQQSGSVTQPLFNNPLAGFLGGAQLGSLFQG